MGKRKSLSRDRLIRRGAIRAPKTKVFLFCEGKVTENLYFQRLLKTKSNAALEVCRAGGVPRTLFDAANSKLKEVNKSGQPDDQVWLVFDCDEHPKVYEVLSADNDIVVGYSNPCFEVWLLYHFADHHAPDERGIVKKKLADITEAYCAKKQALLDPEPFMPRVKDAVLRSESGLNDRKVEGAELGNPCSTMVDILNKFELLT